MKILYIGIFDEGSTSKMRGAAINETLKPDIFDVIDTSNTSFQLSKITFSLGWRYKIGPLIWAINKKITHFDLLLYDLIWIDKGVFIKPETIIYLKKHTKKIIHYTPDAAFYSNQSAFFNKSIPLFDYTITTKTYELELYKHFGCKNLIFTTQGYDPDIHKTSVAFHKKQGIVFIGLYEKERAQIIDFLLKNDIQIKLGGPGWENFYVKHKHCKNLLFWGNTLYGAKYSDVISSSRFGLGFLSKKFPELHTTRTFEIPACGTALLTEKNEETKRYFSDKEVIFYSSKEDLLNKIIFYNNHLPKLDEISKCGYKKVTENGYDYQSILAGILDKILK